MDISPLQIVEAQEQHLPEISQLADRQRPEYSSEESLRSGFLVSEFRECDYRNFVNQPGHFYVLLQAQQVIGFLLGYSEEQIGPHSVVDTKIASHSQKKFVIIKQVCISEPFRRRGLATRLYEHVARQVPECCLYAAIVSEPPNVTSIEFHRKMNFRKLTDIIPRDGIPRSIWHRPSKITEGS